MINAACTRCIQERWPVKAGDEVPAAIAVLNGEGMCMGHMAPPPIDPGDPVIERLARHLRKNYRPGTTDVPWADADAEERDVWCTEAAHFLEIAQLEILGWSVPVSVNHPTVALLPVEETVLPGDFVEDEPPLMVVEGTTKLPPKWSQPRSD